jgi:hypothetical protein
MINWTYMKGCGLRLLAITLIGCSQYLKAQDVRVERHTISDHNLDTFLEYVEPVLKTAGGAARLYFRTSCWTGSGDGIMFPQLRLDTPAQAKTGLAAIRDILRKEKEVNITEGRTGISRISIGEVNYELLNTKIHVLRLSPTQQYNTEEAIVAIERTKEVQAKMRELNLQEPPTVHFGRVLEPAPGRPHLPATMKDVTVDEALDRLAQTFGGLVMYGECDSENGTHLISVDFKYIK